MLRLLITSPSRVRPAAARLLSAVERLRPDPRSLTCDAASSGDESSTTANALCATCVRPAQASFGVIHLFPALAVTSSSPPINPALYLSLKPSIHLQLQWIFFFFKHWLACLRDKEQEPISGEPQTCL